MKIIIDTREPKQNHKFLLQAFKNETFELKALAEGDYATDKVLVERKTVADLYGSIVGTAGKPGRFINQVSRLACHQDQVVLILVIGSVSQFIEDMRKIGIRVNIDILYGAIASVTCRERIHVIWMENEWNALITMVKFMERVETGEYMVPSRREPDTLLARYLKITPKQFKELREKFYTLPGILEATDKELMTINGIGKVKAKNIRELLIKGW